MKPDPNNPDGVLFKDPHTGKTKPQPKPEGFDPYWETKHPKPKPKTQDPTPPGGDNKQQTDTWQTPGWMPPAATLGLLALLCIFQPELCVPAALCAAQR